MGGKSKTTKISTSKTGTRFVTKFPGGKPYITAARPRTQKKK